MSFVSRENSVLPVPAALTSVWFKFTPQSVGSLAGVMNLLLRNENGNLIKAVSRTSGSRWRKQGDKTDNKTKVFFW